VGRLLQVASRGPSFSAQGEVPVEERREPVQHGLLPDPVPVVRREARNRRENLRHRRTRRRKSISLKRTTRLKPEDTPPPAPPAPPSARGYRVGVIIEVDDWEASLRFYRAVLRLDITKQSPSYVSFAGLLALAPAATPRAGEGGQLTINSSSFDSRQAVTIFVPASDLDDFRRRIAASGSAVSPSGERHGRKMFRCLDHRRQRHRAARAERRRESADGRRFGRSPFRVWLRYTERRGFWAGVGGRDLLFRAEAVDPRV